MSDTIQLKSEYEGAEVFSSEPLVAVRNDVISPIECAYLIELAKPHIKRAGVVLDEGFKPSEGRTGSNHWLKYDEDDVVKSIGQANRRYRWAATGKRRINANHPLRPRAGIPAALRRLQPLTRSRTKSGSVGWAAPSYRPGLPQQSRGWRCDAVSQSWALPSLPLPGAW